MPTLPAPLRSTLSITLIVFLLLSLIGTEAHRWYEQRLLREQRAEVTAELAYVGNALSVAVEQRLNRVSDVEAIVRSASSQALFEERLQALGTRLANPSLGLHAIVVAPQGTVQYVYPEADRYLLGHNLLEDPNPDVRASVRRALETNTIILSSPIQLPGGEPGIVVQRALDAEEGEWTLIRLVYRLQPLLRDAGLGMGSDPFRLGIHDHKGNFIYGQADILEHDPALSFVAIGDGGWQLLALPNGGWAAAVRGPLQLFDAFALTVIVLTTGLAYLVSNRQTRLQQAVQLRTQEIAAVNRELMEAQQLLEHRVAERTLELHTLLEASHHITRTLELEPALELILDQLRRLIDSPSAAIFTFNEDRQELRLVSYRSESRPLQMPPPYPLRPGTLDHEVVSGQRHLVIADVLDDSAEARLWQERCHVLYGGPLPGVRSWMAVPMSLKERTVGMLAFGHREPNAYTEHQAELAQAFANHAAVALENARLYEQARTLAALQERQKLARELHDSVSQALYGIGLGTKTALALVASDNVEKRHLAQPLEYVLSLATTGLAEMRALIFELRPESLEIEGLVPALTRRIDALRARQEMGVEALLEDVPEVPVAVQEVLYRVTQEALQNVVKHANASHVGVSLAPCNGEVVLEISDNGRGFELQDRFPGHLGLQSMRERVEAVGGVFGVETAPGQGTIVRVTVPSVSPNTFAGYWLQGETL